MGKYSLSIAKEQEIVFCFLQFSPKKQHYQGHYFLKKLTKIDKIQKVTKIDRKFKQ